MANIEQRFMKICQHNYFSFIVQLFRKRLNCEQALYFPCSGICMSYTAFTAILYVNMQVKTDYIYNKINTLKCH